MSSRGQSPPGKTVTLVLLLLASFCAGLFVPGMTRAQSGLPGRSDSAHPRAGKLSRDIHNKVRNAKASGEPLCVILQLSGPPSEDLDSFLTGINARVKMRFQHLNALSLEIAAGAVEQLADYSEVKYISGNNTLRASGHLTSTTGTDAIRSAVGTGINDSETDGSGIGIAIVDSGIYQSHGSLLKVSSKGVLTSRVTYSQDFTGEGRTDDPYGHGTFVAGVAAGNSSVASNAYGGIAPGAHLINLRVLNAQGTGSYPAC